MHVVRVVHVALTLPFPLPASAEAKTRNSNGLAVDYKPTGFGLLKAKGFRQNTLKTAWPYMPPTRLRVRPCGLTTRLLGPTSCGPAPAAGVRRHVASHSRNAGMNLEVGGGEPRAAGCRSRGRGAAGAPLPAPSPPLSPDSQHAGWGAPCAAGCCVRVGRSAPHAPPLPTAYKA